MKYNNECYIKTQKQLGEEQGKPVFAFRTNFSFADLWPENSLSQI